MTVESVESVIGFPLTILQYIGVLNSPAGTTHWSRRLRIFFGLVVTGCGLAYCGVRITIAILHASVFHDELNRPGQKQQPGLLVDLIDLWDVVVTFRGPFCLFLLSCRATLFQQLIYDAQAAATATFRDDYQYSIRLKKWRRTGTLAWVATGLYLAAWETVSWCSTYIPKHETAHEYSSSLRNIGLTVLVWCNTLWWVTTCTLNYWLAQQIYLLIFISGKILEDCMQSISVRLKTEVEFLEPRNCAPALSSQPEFILKRRAKEIEHHGENLEDILRVRHVLVRFSTTLSETFGTVFCVLYLMDIALALGCLASFICGWGTSSVFSLVRSGIGVATFGTYAVIFVIPLILSTEINTEIQHTISFYADAVALRCSTKGYNEPLKQLRRLLLTYQLGCSHQEVGLHGLHVLHATRTQVITTFAFIGSFGIITNELLKGTATVVQDGIQEITANLTSQIASSLNETLKS